MKNRPKTEEVKKKIALHAMALLQRAANIHNAYSQEIELAVVTWGLINCCHKEQYLSSGSVLIVQSAAVDPAGRSGIQTVCAEDPLVGVVSQFFMLADFWNEISNWWMTFRNV